MKLLSLTALLLCAVLLLSGCATGKKTMPEEPSAPSTDTESPRYEEQYDLSASDEATLWFRFSSEPYLAPESRTITPTQGQSYEMALLETLFSGPLFADGWIVRETAERLWEEHQTGVRDRTYILFDLLVLSLFLETAGR